MTTGNRIGQARLELVADGKGLKKDLDTAEKNTKKRVGEIGKTLTKTLTPAIAAIGGAVFLATEKMDRAFGIIQTGTGASGEALEGLKDDFKGVSGTVTASSEEIATALADVNTRLGITGEALQDVTRVALEGGINVNQLAQSMDIFGVATEGAVPLMDKLFVISQDTGIGMDTLTKNLQIFGPVLDNAGFSAEEAAVLFGQLNAAGVDANRIMPGLNAFMRKAAEEGITDIKGALGEVITNMQGASTSSEALNIATAAFGAEGAQRMVTAVNAGALSLDEMVSSLEMSEGAILTNAEATRTNTEKMAMMREEITERLAGAWQSLPGPIQAVGLGLGGVLTTAGPLLMALPGLTTAASALSLANLKNAATSGISATATVARTVATIAQTVATVAGTVATTAFGVALAIATGPIGLIVAAIVGLIAVGVLLYKNWDKVSAKAKAIWEAVAGFVKENWDIILAILFPHVGLPLLIFRRWGAITDVVRNIWNGAADAVKGAVNLMLGYINSVIRAWNGLELRIPSKTFDLPFGQSVTFGGASIGTPDIPLIPLLAEGGIVTSPTLALLGEAGPEAIIPLGRGGGMGGGITIMGDVYGYDDFVDKVGEANVDLEERGG